MPEFLDYANWIEGRQARRDQRRDGTIQGVLSAIMGIKEAYDERQAAKQTAAKDAEQQAYERSVKAQELGLKERAQGLAEHTALSTQAQQEAQRIASEIGAAMDYVLSQPPEQQQDAYTRAMTAIEKKNPGFTPEEFGFFPQFDPQMATAQRESWRRLSPEGQKVVPKPAEPYTLSPGSTRYGPNDQPVANVPATPPRVTYGAPQPFMVGGKRIPLRAGSDGQMYDMAGRAVEPDSIELEPNGPGARPQLSPAMEANILNRITNQWTAASKPARELDRQVSMMEEGVKAAQRGDLAQGAQVILVTFQKILDPPSVVRESEFMRSAAGQSLMNRARGAYERMTKGGGGVTLAELEKFAQLAKEISNVQNREYLKATKERIGRTADRYGIPRDIVFEEMPETEVPPPPVRDAGKQNIGRFEVEVQP